MCSESQVLLCSEHALSVDWLTETHGQLIVLSHIEHREIRVYDDLALSISRGVTPLWAHTAFVPSQGTGFG